MNFGIGSIFSYSPGSGFSDGPGPYLDPPYKVYRAAYRWIILFSLKLWLQIYSLTQKFYTVWKLRRHTSPLMRSEMALCVVISNIPLSFFVFPVVIALMSEHDHAKNSILEKDASNSCQIFVFLVLKSVMQLLIHTFSEAVIQRCCILKSCSEKFCKTHKNIYKDVLFFLKLPVWASNFTKQDFLAGVVLLNLQDFSKELYSRSDA